MRRAGYGVQDTVSGHDYGQICGQQADIALNQVRVRIKATGCVRVRVRNANAADHTKSHRVTSRVI